MESPLVMLSSILLILATPPIYQYCQLLILLGGITDQLLYLETKPRRSPPHIVGDLKYMTSLIRQIYLS